MKRGGQIFLPVRLRSKWSRFEQQLIGLIAGMGMLVVSVRM